MMQRMLMIVLIVAIVLGGGFYAYRELVPPPKQEVTGPVYSTKPVTKGDITVGIDVTGPLNPSRSGGIQAPGSRSYYDAPSSNVQYTLVEILAEEGSEVTMGQVIAKLAAPELQSQIKSAQDEVDNEKRFLAELTGLPEESLHSINPSQGVTLRASIDGRVSGLAVKEGKEIKQGEIVARIVDDSHYKISAKILPHEFKLIKNGQKVALRFSMFDGVYYGNITDVNPNAVPDGDDETPGKGFVHWITVEGKNPGLVRSGIEAYIGLPSSTGDEAKIQWFADTAKVEGFVDEEKVLSTVEAMATEVHVKEMETVKKGDPIISLAGSDVQKTIQEKLNKIREKESQLNELYAKAGQMDVRSPMDGIIAEWDSQLGAQIRPGQWMGHVYNTADMSMWVEVDDVDVLLVKQDSPVKVTVEALANEAFEGKVEHISTMGKNVQGITQFMVDISVKGGPNLRPGMQAKAYIDAGNAENVLLAPVEAIFEEDGTQKVEVLNPDGSTKAVAVKLGLMNDKFAEIKSGINEGDLVITGSSADLLPSQHIGSKDSIIPSKDDDGKDKDKDDGDNKKEPSGE